MKQQNVITSWIQTHLFFLKKKFLNISHCNKKFNWKNCIKLFTMYYSWEIISPVFYLTYKHTHTIHDYSKDFSVLSKNLWVVIMLCLPIVRRPMNDSSFYTVVCFSSKWHIIIVNSSTQTQTKLCYIYNCCRL